MENIKEVKTEFVDVQVPVQIPKKQRTITYKQKIFVKEYIKNKFNGTKAALKVYDTKSNKIAQALASENLLKPVIQKELEDALKDAGLSDDIVADHLNKAMTAGLGQQARNSDSLRAIDMYWRLRNKYPTTTKRIEKLNISLQLHGKTDQEVDEMLSERTKLVEQLKSE